MRIPPLGVPLKGILVATQRKLIHASKAFENGRVNAYALITLLLIIFCCTSAFAQLPENDWVPAQYVIQGQTAAWYDAYPNEGICPTTDNINCTGSGSTSTPFRFTGAISVGHCESYPPSTFVCYGDVNQASATFHYYVDGVEIGTETAYQYNANYPFYWEAIDEIGDYNIWWGSTSYLMSGNGVHYTFTSAGTHTVAVKINGSSQTAMSTTVNISTNSSLQITTVSLPDGMKNATYNGVLVASGGTVPYSWSIISGALPAGLSLNPATGVISGAPTSTGISAFTVRVTDAASVTAVKALTINVDDTTGTQLQITTDTLPGATVQTPYSVSLAAIGGVSPYTWSIVSGSLPSGLSLNSATGVISGTPTNTGTSTFTTQVQDSNSSVATKSMSIAVQAQQIQQCNIWTQPNPLVLVSIDYYRLDEFGLPYLVWQVLDAKTAYALSTYPTCVQVGYAWATESRLAFAGANYPIKYGDAWLSSYLWIDTGFPYLGDPDFYPQLAFGAVTVFGVNAINGDVFASTNATSLFVGAVYLWN